MHIKIYRYIDGNNNEYVIKGDPLLSVEYNPVKPRYSSSGIYDGGEPKKKEISNHQYNNMIGILNQTTDKKEIQMNDRVKLSGMIVIQENDKHSTFIIKPHSKEIGIIEENLKSLMED
ncbi:MAG: hypothetical protein ACW986_07345 [Promethearchaeota archaeon]|jgi:hypothetical protein